MPKLLDGKYFSIVKRDGTKVEAKCENCGLIRKGTVTSTGNFMEHIRKMHSSIVSEAETYRKLGSTDEKLEKIRDLTIKEMFKKFTKEDVSLC